MMGLFDPTIYIYIDGLVQDCSNSSAFAMELLQSYIKPSIYIYVAHVNKGFGLISTDDIFPW